MQLNIGCGEWGFRTLPMERHFALCAELGFRCMEIGIGGGQVGRLPERMSDAEVAAFAAMRARYGIRTPFCCLENDFTLPDAEAHAAMLTEVLAQMRLAARLACTHVRLFAGFTPYDAMTEENWGRLFAAFAIVDAEAAELGVQIAIETHGKITLIAGTAVHTHTVTTHREGLRRLLQGLPPRVGINYDPGNLKAADPTDTRFALDLLNDRINYCHLKDWLPRGAGFVAAAPGDGDLDYGVLLPQLAYDGVLLIEYEPVEDVEDGLRRSLAYLCSLGEVHLAE